MTHRNRTRDDDLNHRQPEHSHFLFEGVEFPVTKQELVELVTASQPDVDLMNLVRALPDHDYGSRDEIWRAWAEAQRRFGSGARNLGAPRDNLGHQATNDRGG
jgi:hypothetical protein